MLMALSVSAMAQAFKPTIMVRPSDDWCQQNGCMNTNGSPDYPRAVMNSDFLEVISAINGRMASYCELVSLPDVLKTLKTERAFNQAMTTRGGAEITMTMVDEIAETAHADFYIDVFYRVVPNGGRSHYISCRIDVKDAANDKTIYSISDQSESDANPVSTHLQRLMSGNIVPNVRTAFMGHFEKYKTRGREAQFLFRIGDDCPLNFESEVTVDGESGELGEYIEAWLEDHAVDNNIGGGNMSNTYTTRRYEQVMMPLTTTGGFGGRERKTDANRFIQPLLKSLKQFGVTARVQSFGVGKVMVFLGGPN